GGGNRRGPLVRNRPAWRSDPVHGAPVSRCSCGIYATSDPELAAESLYLYSEVHQPHVVYRAVGLVSLWGSVVEGECGWRASRAYPKRLFLPPSQRPEDVERIRDGLADYGVPVEILDHHQTPIAPAAPRA